MTILEVIALARIYMKKLTRLFLDNLIVALDNENTSGILLTGSYARAESGQYSDVDIYQYLREIPERTDNRYSLRFMDDFLVSITLTTFKETVASLRDPPRAIWAIPGLRQSRILLDKEGAIAHLKATAINTTWETLQSSADLYNSQDLCGCAEEIHKILAGLAQKDESKTLYAVWGLTHAMAIIMLVQNGVLIQSENVMLDLAQETAGRTSWWTHQFRLAIGLDPLPLGEPAFVGYGVASLGLFRESARLFRGILSQADAFVVDRTLSIITEAGI